MSDLWGEVKWDIKLLCLWCWKLKASLVVVVFFVLCIGSVSVLLTISLSRRVCWTESDDWDEGGSSGQYERSFCVFLLNWWPALFSIHTPALHASTVFAFCVCYLLLWWERWTSIAFFFPSSSSDTRLIDSFRLALRQSCVSVVQSHAKFLI